MPRPEPGELLPRDFVGNHTDPTTLPPDVIAACPQWMLGYLATAYLSGAEAQRRSERVRAVAPDITADAVAEALYAVDGHRRPWANAYHPTRARYEDRAARLMSFIARVYQAGRQAAADERKEP